MHEGPQAIADAEVITLSDNGSMDHPHESDDDDEDDEGVLQLMEYKLVIAPGGRVVKVEKDW